MKKLYLTNKWIFIGTLLLYLTFYLGLTVQIVLGLIQILTSIYFTFNTKVFKKLKNELLLYWILVALYVVFILIVQNSGISGFTSGLIYFAIIPMGIASYFLYITWKVNKIYHEL
ncbi:MAG: hypothetical protein NWQ38_04530 [Cellulophaga sp.]|nr:hypothetical protein [Cellulophaga sp.]